MREFRRASARQHDALLVSGVCCSPRVADVKHMDTALRREYGKPSAEMLKVLSEREFKELYYDARRDPLVLGKMIFEQVGVRISHGTLMAYHLMAHVIPGHLLGGGYANADFWNARDFSGSVLEQTTRLNVFDGAVRGGLQGVLGPAEALSMSFKELEYFAGVLHKGHSWSMRPFKMAGVAFGNGYHGQVQLPLFPS